MSRQSHTNTQSGSTKSSDMAVPTLRVMRLQSPEISTSSHLDPACALHTSLCLPDSLAVYVGEYFTAYLGVLNSSSTHSIRRLTVSAQLQTPSQRYQLPSRLDQTGNNNNNSGSGMDVAANSGVDAIVSRVIDEAGQHILRVEVGYQTPDGGSKTFRKFYRFQVLSPLTLTVVNVVRAGDSKCLVSLAVEVPNQEKQTTHEPLVLSFANFGAATGLTSTAIACTDKDDSDTQTSTTTTPKNTPTSALDLFDSVVTLTPNHNGGGGGGVYRYLFAVETSSADARLRGIAAGDYLGRGVVSWRKAMGETGTVSSLPVHCPKTDFGVDTTNTATATTTTTVVHRSGWSVDVAAQAAASQHLTDILITLEPIDPPSTVTLLQPYDMQCLIVNHSATPLSLQLRVEGTLGLAVAGLSHQTLGTVRGNGGSIVATLRLLPLHGGVQTVDGCVLVDLATGREVPQPALCHVFVQAVVPEASLTTPSVSLPSSSVQVEAGSSSVEVTATTPRQATVPATPEPIKPVSRLALPPGAAEISPAGSELSC